MYQVVQNYLSDLFLHLQDITDNAFYILFYDDFTSRVLNIFTIKQLRAFNIVSLQHISTIEEQHVDLSAIFYLSNPSLSYFSNCFIYFSKATLLLHHTLHNAEALADLLSKHPTDTITLIYDTYTHYMLYDTYCMTCPPIKGNISSLLTSSLGDKQLLNQAIHSISSMYMTMRLIPTIYHDQHPNCKYVSEELLDLFSIWTQEYQQAKGANDYFDQLPLYSGYGHVRPKLIVLHRSEDLLPFLMHSWSYNNLIFDLYKMNQLQVVDKQIDIDPLDLVWKEHATQPFPIVAEHIDKSLQEYKIKAQDIMSYAGISNMEELQMDSMTNTSQLKTVLTQLPELTNQKQILDNHMQIASSLLQTMQDISLDQVFEHEEKLLKLTIDDILSILNKEWRAIDRVKIALLWYSVKHTNEEELMAALQKVGMGTGCLEFLKHMRQTKTSGERKKNNFNFSLKWSEQSATLNNIITSVKNLMPFETKSSLVKTVEMVMDGVSDLACLEPLGKDHTVPFGGYVYPDGVPQVFVYVVGSGHWIEYNQILELGKKMEKQIGYGCMEMMTSERMISQMDKL